jgi:hypothetical protein
MVSAILTPLLQGDLEEFIHLLQHLFDAQAYGVALLVERVELGLGGGQGFALGGGDGLELGAECGYFCFSGCACFALALDDLNGAEDFLLEGLELFCGDPGTDGGCAGRGYL